MRRRGVRRTGLEALYHHTPSQGQELIDAFPLMSAKSGGSRSQRRNQAKKKFKTLAATETSASEADEKAEEVDKNAEAVLGEVVETSIDTSRKKTKKEKKRERKAAEQQVAQAASLDSQPKKRSREEAAAAAAAGLRLFVGRLPQSTTEDELRALFDGVAAVDMVRRPDTGRFKGSAFLIFDSEAAATKALKLDGHLWQRSAGSAQGEGAAGAPEPKQIMVARARSGSDGDAGAGDNDAQAGESGGAKRAKLSLGGSEPSLSVHVGNLPADCKEKALRDCLRACGKIQKVTLLPPKAEDPTMRSGFVDFQSLEASTAAIKLNNTSLLGRVLTLNFSARARPPSSGGRRSTEAKRRRKEKRESQRAAAAEGATVPDSTAPPADAS